MSAIIAYLTACITSFVAAVWLALHWSDRRWPPVA